MCNFNCNVFDATSGYTVNVTVTCLNTLSKVALAMELSP